MTILLAENEKALIPAEAEGERPILCMNLDSLPLVESHLTPISLHLVLKALERDMQVIVAGIRSALRSLKGLDDLRVTFLEKPDAALNGEALKSFVLESLIRAAGPVLYATPALATTKDDDGRELVRHKTNEPVHPDYLKPVLSEEDYRAFYSYARGASGEMFHQFQPAAHTDGMGESLSPQVLPLIEARSTGRRKAGTNVVGLVAHGSAEAVGEAREHTMTMLETLVAASRKKSKKADLPFSSNKKSIAQALQDKGFIEGYKVMGSVLRVFLKYDAHGKPALHGYRLVSGQHVTVSEEPVVKLETGPFAPFIVDHAKLF